MVSITPKGTPGVWDSDIVNIGALYVCDGCVCVCVCVWLIVTFCIITRGQKGLFYTILHCMCTVNCV